MRPAARSLSMCRVVPAKRAKSGRLIKLRHFSTSPDTDRNLQRTAGRERHRRRRKNNTLYVKTETYCDPMAQSEPSSGFAHTM